MRFALLLPLLTLIAGWSWEARGHPASLEDYPERFPGKTLQTLADEWEPRPADALSEADLLSLTRDIAETWAQTPPEELKKRILDLLEQNRRGDYRKRIANSLNDMLDLIGGGTEAQSPEAVAYVLWRIENLNADDGFFDGMTRGDWSESKEKLAARTRQWQEERQREVAALGARADTASNLLRPHWLIQCGALEFKHRRYSEAAACFQRVCEAFPQHPRAEVATLMLARVKYEEWRQTKRMTSSPETGQESRLEREIWQAFNQYEKRYPQGRFVADLNGWHAGIARAKEQFGHALMYCLLQANEKDHPEVRRRAFQQIEWILSDLARQPDSLHPEGGLWSDIAAEPLVALRLCYFMLDAESETDLGALMFRRSGEDHRVLESLAPKLAGVRAVAGKTWRQLDKALALHADAYQGDRAIIRTVLHAWSAVMSGEPGLAIATVPAKPTGLGADDALLVRAFARIKAGQDAEAIRALDDLDQQCPNSALCRGGDFRRAEAWIHLGQSAAAVPLLWRMLEGKDISHRQQISEDRPPLHLPGEIGQRLAAVLSFAPLDQLTQAAAVADAPPPLRLLLRATLRVRHLGEERFEQALACAEDADFAAEHRHDQDPSPWAPQARERISSLHRLTTAVTQAAGSEAKGAAWLALGKAWERNLGRLFLSQSVYLSGSYTPAYRGSPDFELRRHAGLLHVPDTAAAALLDQQQETTHAIHCYDEALKLAAPGSTASLTAMLALHAALRTRAETSEYFRDRAVELGDAARDRELHDRIKKEHPGTPAAEQIVWWSFHPSRTFTEWRPGSTALFAREAELATLLGTGEKTNYWVSDWNTETKLQDLTRQLKLLSTETDLVKLRGEITRLRIATRRDAPTAKAAVLLNHLDDLELLLAVPNLSTPALTAYFTARMEGTPMDAASPAFAEIKDFVTFWNYASTPSTTALTEAEKQLAEADKTTKRPDRQRIAQAQVSRMNAFLHEFPKSAKREAALARLAINTLRQSRSHCGMISSGYSIPRPTNYAGFAIARGIPFSAPVVYAALDQYDREFPNGRYQAEIQLIRAIAASEAQDLPTAVKLFVTILDTPGHRGLHLDASNNLCALFMDLLIPEKRTPLIAALKAHPAAWPKLDLFLHSPTLGWQLHILEDWLHSQR